MQELLKYNEKQQYGIKKNGKVVDLIVIPETRRKDIVNYLNPEK